MRAFIVLLGLAACAGVPVRDLAPDEIAVHDVRLPEGARPGMFITWAFSGSRMHDDSVVEETIACVAADPLTVEWRETLRDGTATVTAARYREDGTLLGVWRGRAGSVGEPLKVVENEFDLDEAMAEADRAGRPFGLSTKDAEAQTLRERETIETPVGPIPCVRHSIQVSLLFVSGRMTIWRAETPLPLSRIVRFEGKGPLDHYELQELVAYGWTGAEPMLTLPPHRPAG